MGATALQNKVTFFVGHPVEIGETALKEQSESIQSSESTPGNIREQSKSIRRFLKEPREHTENTLKSN